MTLKKYTGVGSSNGAGASKIFQNSSSRVESLTIASNIAGISKPMTSVAKNGYLNLIDSSNPWKSLMYPNKDLRFSGLVILVREVIQIK